MVAMFTVYLFDDAIKLVCTVTPHKAINPNTHVKRTRVFSLFKEMKYHLTLL